MVLSNLCKSCYFNLFHPCELRQHQKKNPRIRPVAWGCDAQTPGESFEIPVLTVFAPNNWIFWYSQLALPEYPLGFVWKSCTPKPNAEWSLSLLNGYNWRYTLFSDKTTWTSCCNPPNHGPRVKAFGRGLQASPFGDKDHSTQDSPA